jgi:hypothetical protein
LPPAGQSLSLNLPAIGVAWDTIAMAGQSEYKQTPNGLEYPYDLVEVSGLIEAPQDDEDSINFSIANDSVDDFIQHLDFDIIASAGLYGAALGDYGVQVNFNSIVFDSAYVTNTMGWGDNGSGDSIYSFGIDLYPGALSVQMSANDDYDVTETSN